jgi:hypothetical protein
MKRQKWLSGSDMAEAPDERAHAASLEPHPRSLRGRPPAALAGLLLVLLSPILAACNDVSKPAAISLEWGILDNETKAASTVANGGAATINPSHQYYVTLRVKDPAAIKVMSIWGEGSFTCETDHTKNGGQFWDAPSPLGAGLPRQDTTLPGTATYDGFVQSAPFTYFDISCGTRSYANVPGPQEYFAISGTLHIKGRDTNQAGTVTDATLDLNPG